MALFNFELYPFSKCPLPNHSKVQSDSYNLSWHWLSYCDYYIKAGDTILYEASGEWKIKYPVFQTNPFLDYQFAHFLNDLFEKLPYLSHPMPKKWFEKMNTNDKRKKLHEKVIDMCLTEKPEEYDEFDQLICDFYNMGDLDDIFLSHPPTIRFTHYQDKIIIYWDCTTKDDEGLITWAGGIGQHTILYSDFLLEVEDLLDRFFQAMDNQMNQIKSYLIRNPQQTKYFPHGYTQEQYLSKEISKEPFHSLLEEHQQRKEFFYSILSKVKNNEYPPFSWDQLEVAWKILEMDNKKG